jgi:hypothetical protein
MRKIGQRSIIPPPNIAAMLRMPRHDQTTRRVLTAAADLAAVCTALGGRAHRRAGDRAGLKG